MRSLTRYDDAFHKCACVYVCVCEMVIGGKVCVFVMLVSGNEMALLRWRSVCCSLRLIQERHLLIYFYYILMQGNH